MIDLTPEEREYLKRKQNPAAPNENDKQRAKEAAMQRQAAIARGETPPDPMQLAMQQAVKEKALEHAIRMKHLRHYAGLNWWMLQVARLFLLQERREHVKVEGESVLYLKDLSLGDWLSGASSDEDKIKVGIFTQGLGLVAGFGAEQFRWNPQLEVTETWHPSERIPAALGAGTFWVENLGPGTPFGVPVGESRPGHFLLDRENGGTWFITTDAEPASGTWTLGASGSFTVTHRGETLAGTRAGSTWQLPGASGTFSHAEVIYPSLVSEFVSKASFFGEKIADWFARIVDMKRGSAVELAAMKQNSAPPPAVPEYEV